MQSLRNAAGVVFFVSLAAASAADPTIESTTYLGPFAGAGMQWHPDNVQPNQIEFAGTDLGFSYQHGTQLQFLFGDSWAKENYAPIEASTGSRFDDGFGSVDLEEWSDPSRIQPGHIPLIKLGQNLGTTEMSAINPGHAMDLGKTPMGGFSNGTDEFGIFNITKPRGCAADTDCSNGLSCDKRLGYMGAKYTDEENLTLTCRDGAPGCNVDTMLDAAGKAVPDSGFCIDPTSVFQGESITSLITPAGLNVRIARRNHETPKLYADIRDWLTNKFVNVTVRTVEAFDPTKPKKANYASARGSGGERRVFLWGRPGFVGVAANKHALPLYFAYLDMPTGTGYAWQPHYYTGTINGVPQFSTQEKDAAAADLDSTQPGVQEETIDIVNQMSVAWVAPLRKWVMFYGGGLTNLPSPPLSACGVTQLFTGAECKAVNMGNGAVRMRTADQPWGPWSPPQDVVTADPKAGAQGQYGPGGALRHPDCKDPTCAPHSSIFVYHAEEYGFFYSANIVEEWIRPAGNGVDVIWNASTWDPYRVVLLRTHIRK